MSFLRTNLEIDLKTLREVKKITGLKTTKEAVNFSLRRLARSSEALDTLARLKGRIHFSKNYSYKKSRG